MISTKKSTFDMSTADHYYYLKRFGFLTLMRL